MASSLLEDSFALIFGINTMVALVIQSLLTLIVVSETGGLNLNTFEQFAIYAFYFIVIGTLYFIAVIMQYVFSRSKSTKTYEIHSIE